MERPEGARRLSAGIWRKAGGTVAAGGALGARTDGGAA